MKLYCFFSFSIFSLVFLCYRATANTNKASVNLLYLCYCCEAPGNISASKSPLHRQHPLVQKIWPTNFFQDPLISLHSSFTSTDMISLRKLEQIIQKLLSVVLRENFCCKIQKSISCYFNLLLQMGSAVRNIHFRKITSLELIFELFSVCPSHCFDFPLLQNHKVNTHNLIKWPSDSEYYLITPQWHSSKLIEKYR